MFCAARGAVRSRKRPCQPKTVKRIFGGPGSHGPSGQAKEQMRILPVRRGFSAPNVPRHVPGWPLFRSLPLSGLLAFVPGAPAFFLQAQHVRGESFGAACPARLPCAEDTGFWLLFHAQPKEGASLFLPCSAAFSLACALPAAFVKVFTPAAWLPVLCFCVRGFFLLFFHLFLPDFFLSKFFSFVAQAATGLYFLPKRK